MRALGDTLVVITGAGGGIGRALAHGFVRRGCKLALLDLDGEAIDGVARSLREQGAAVSTHVVDVRVRGDLERARDQILAAHGRVDVLINNAGLTVFASLEHTSDDEIDRVIAVNLRAVIDGCRVFLPALRERPRAHIVNLSSIAGLAGMPWQTLYCATKFAVRGFSAALRSELVGQGIGVTCVLPGATRTNIVGVAASRDLALSSALSRQLLAYGYPPAWVARKVVRAVRWNWAEVASGPDALLLRVGVRVAPSLVRGAMRALVWGAGRRAWIGAGEASPAQELEQR
ncbi:SDR family NAD(P)-dependent oxidoreductase [Enhygromyxa salina]|uniref:Putative oxidoreductase SadH n=1 Tax=Enhygromyxa salina TaxID=215803 RepID=A0A2S9XCK2_9BACT|nr:SDR family oxidoreductase [Enhygromyxa salina]PRP90411.1 putative oxidoreductase SadH [Enhygromyxa salina]